MPTRHTAFNVSNSGWLMDGINPDLDRISNDCFTASELRIALRILLYERLPDGKEFRVIKDHAVNYYGADGQFDANSFVLRADLASDLFFLNDCNDTTYEIWEDKLRGSVGKRSLRNEAAESYVLQQTGYGCRIYIDKEYNKTFVLLSRRRGAAESHIIGSMIPVLFPNYFESKPLTDTEREILKALSEGDENTFVTLTEELSNSIGLKDSYIKRQFKGFSLSALETKKQRLLNDIEVLQHNIEELEKRVADALVKREHKNYEYAGLEMKLNSKESSEEDIEIADFFASSKVLKLRGVYGSEVDFDVVTPINNFNIDMYEDYIKNKRSVFYNTAWYPNGEVDKYLPLIRMVFEEPNKVQLMTGISFCIDFENYRREGNSDTGYTDNLKDIVPNPHFRYYRCWGDNARLVDKAIQERDYITAFSLCIAVAGNINLAETQNVSHLIQDSLHHRLHAFRINGVQYSANEAIEILGLNKEEHNEQTN